MSLRKVLDRRHRESKASFSVACSEIKGVDPAEAAVSLFLWISDRIDGPIKEKISMTVPGSCFVAYRYFDFRLWRHNPLNGDIQPSPEIVGFTYGGASVCPWKVVFHVKDPKEAVGEDDRRGHTCEAIQCQVEVKASGEVQILSIWSGPALGKQNGPAIHVNCRLR